MINLKSDWNPIIIGFIITQVIGTTIDFYSTQNLLTSFSYVLLINCGIWVLALTSMTALTWLSNKEQ